MERKEIFRGKDIIVVESFHEGSPDVAITFSPFHDRGERRSGYGEKLFAREKVSAIYFINRHNHWWQTPEMAQAITVVGSYGLNRRFRNVTTYGSSMGGHGALLFARSLGANRTLALAPQFAVGGRNAVWRRGWQTREELYRYEDHHSPDVEATIAYDPRHPFDRSHAKAFRAVGNIAEVHVPFCHHNCAAALVEMKLMSRFALDYIAGRCDLKALAADIRARRRDSLTCLSGLKYWVGHRTQQGCMLDRVRTANVRLFLDYLERGAPIRIKSTLRPIITPYLNGLNASGQRERSVEIAQGLHDSNPRSPETAFLLADQLVGVGRPLDAYTVLLACFRRNRNNAACAVRACGAAMDAGLEREAHRLLKTALALPQQNASAWIRFLRDHHDRLPHRIAVRIYRIAAQLSPQHRHLARVSALVRGVG